MSKRVRKPPTKVGDVYGRLTVIEAAEPAWKMDKRRGKKSPFKRWLCSCSCGATPQIVQDCNLRNGHTNSCGCFQKERVVATSLIHGHKTRRETSPEYCSWRHLKERCLNSNNKRYPGWGGRGITVCDRWRNSFEAFLEDMGPKPEPKRRYSLDRIDVNGNYEPGNCRWATIEEQANNKQRTDMQIKVGQYTLDGEFVAEYSCAAEAGKKNGWDRGNISGCAKGQRKTSYGFVWRYLNE